MEPDESTRAKAETSRVIRAYAWLIRPWYPVTTDPELVRAEIDRWWQE